MSMASCTGCGAIVDTDLEPDGFYGSKFFCGRCRVDLDAISPEEVEILEAVHDIYFSCDSDGNVRDPSTFNRAMKRLHHYCTKITGEHDGKLVWTHETL